MKLNIKKLTAIVAVAGGLFAQQAVIADANVPFDGTDANFIASGTSTLDASGLKTALDLGATGGSWTIGNFTYDGTSGTTDGYVGIKGNGFDLDSAFQFDSAQAEFTLTAPVTIAGANVQIDVASMGNAGGGIGGTFFIGKDENGAELFKLYFGNAAGLPSDVATGAVGQRVLSYITTNDSGTTFTHAIKVSDDTLETGGVVTLNLAASTYELKLTPTGGTLTTVASLPYTVTTGTTLKSLEIVTETTVKTALNIDNLSVTAAGALVSTIGNDINTTVSGVTINEPAPGVLDNDTLENGDKLDISNVLSPDGGGLSTLTLSADGSYVFVPEAGITGDVVFTYEIVDSSGSPLTPTALTATVTITIQGMVFHYKLDEDPTATFVSDSLSKSANSEAFVPANVAMRGANYSVQEESYSAYFSKAGAAIRIVGTEQAPVTPNLSAGVTMVAWVKITSNATVADWTGIIHQRSGGGPKSNGLLIKSGTTLGLDWGDSREYTFAGVGNITKGKWCFVAVTIQPNATGAGTGGRAIMYCGTADGALTASTPLVDTKFNATGTFRTLSFGMDSYQPPSRVLNCNMRNVRIYDYALPQAPASAGDSIESLFDTEKNNVLTPVVGLELVQNGTELTWTLESEVGVIEYQVVNAATGDVIQTIEATEGDSYSVTLPEGVQAELVVVDNHGSQTYLPTDGNIVKTPYGLKKGWNLIAITGDYANVSPLQAVAEGPLWGWNGSSYERTTAPIATQAVWVNSAVETRVDVTAEKSDAKVTLTSGWNLVGPTNNEVMPKAALSVFSYDKIYNSITEEDDVLIRGVGYWIFSL